MNEDKGLRYSVEAQFFNDISKKIIAHVQDSLATNNITHHKGIEGDFATAIDVSVEKITVSEIQKRFPGDSVLAEEEHSGTEIGQGRIWVIDPICGTTNLGRGMSTFCTNIAIVENKIIVASCVVDHSMGDYYWSVGDNTVFKNSEIFRNTKKDIGTYIDIDFGAVINLEKDKRKQLVAAIEKIALETDYMLSSLNTSLTFLYVAVGKIDGFINVYNHPWDICASAFLIVQLGGTITDIQGETWSVDSVGAIGSISKETHNKLLNFYNPE